MLKPNERIDDLQRNNYRIIQDPERFCFGMDAVLLSGFAKAKEGDHVIDLGTGTGIIPMEEYLNMMTTVGAFRSGNTSTSVCMAVYVPAISRRMAAQTTTNRLCRE